jgi:hypothetical protein
LKETPLVPILPPLAALVLFALWALVLVLAIGGWRATMVFSGKSAITGFPSGTQHGGDAYWRLNRAHMNTLENLPVFATLVLTGVYLKADDPAFLLMPSVILYARITQSIIHVTSGTALAINLRFAAYVVQVAAMFVIGWSVFHAPGVNAP